MCMRNATGTPWMFDLSTASTLALKYDGASNVCPRPGFTATAWSYNSSTTTMAINGTASATTISGSTGLATGATSVGTAFGSFPACSAANDGRILYDSTNSALRMCWGAGTTWGAIAVANRSTFGAYFPGIAGLLNLPLAQTNVTAGLMGWAATTANFVQVLTATVLVAGTGAGTATFSVYNATDSADNATVTINCAGTAGTVTTGSGYSSLTAFPKDLQLRLTVNGCTTLPQVNLTAQFTMTKIN